MVTKTELNEKLDETVGTLTATLNENFQKLLKASIDELKNTIIDNLKKSNEILQLKVQSMEGEISSLKNQHIDFVKRTEAAIQHGRLEQMIVSGIPERIPHDDLEKTSSWYTKPNQRISDNIERCCCLPQNW